MHAAKSFFRIVDLRADCSVSGQVAHQPCLNFPKFGKKLRFPTRPTALLRVCNSSASRSMAMTRHTSVVQIVRGILSGGRLWTAPDKELLQRFLDAHDEAAFEEILHRHG